jgi:hypothetical protein
MGLARSAAATPIRHPHAADNAQRLKNFGLNINKHDVRADLHRRCCQPSKQLMQSQRRQQDHHRQKNRHRAVQKFCNEGENA